jgi:SAM-dependent methyltransferase
VAEKQVDASHYAFGGYMTKQRWISVWHQLNEIIRRQPGTVLEIGPGAGVFKHAAGLYGIAVETLDLDPELKPDHVGSATEMPFADGSYDVVCAFQVLEHLPYEASLQAFAEMSRVARKTVIISLPDAMPMWRFAFRIPRFGERQLLLRRPFFRPRPHVFDGEHHWEINKTGYPFDRILRDLSRIRPLDNTFRVPENPYHRFLVFG